MANWIKETLRRWAYTLPFMVALGTLGFMVWSAVRLITFPYDGFLATRTFKVWNIDPSGPAAGKLMTEDVISSIDGIPVGLRDPFYRQKKPGEVVNFIVQRKDNFLPISFVLMDPRIDEIVKRLVPILVAFSFG